MDNYLEVNKESWNRRVAGHLSSDMYNMPEFLKGATSLKEIEIDLLGDIKGKSLLHLQCHFGQDTMSLERMGANCTGIDLSNEAIEQATKINEELGLKTKFICTDVYNTLNHVNEKFDIVYTSYGTIGWLPDLEKWASIISSCLKPGGKLVFVEFHPVVWMYDDDFTHVKFPYHGGPPIVETQTGSYAGESKDEFSYVCWNHGLQTVLNSLIKHGIEIKDFQEYDYSPYDCFAQTDEFETGKFRIKKFGNKIPMVYSVVGVKG